MFTSSDKGKERLDICMKCPYLKNRESMNRKCSRCGCYMTAKVKIANARCPLGKW